MGFATILENLTLGILGLFGRTTDNYVDLETFHSKQILSAKDGSMCTLIHWNGTLRMVGEPEYAQIIDSLGTRLGPALAKPGHQIQIVFTSEGEESNPESALGVHFRSMRVAAKKLHLDVEDILKDRYKRLSELCIYEECYIAIWTYPEAISQDDRKQAIQDRREARKGMPLAMEAQDTHSVIEQLFDTHQSFVELVCAQMKMLQMDVRVMDVRESLRTIRRHIDQEFTATDWNPALPGDTLIPRMPIPGKPDDVSNLLWPTLTSQLIPREPEVHEKYVAIGDRLWAPVMITLQPLRTFPFQAFLTRMRTTRCPYRISFRITGGGLEHLQFNASASDALQTGSAKNKIIAEAFKRAKNLNNRGNTVVGFSSIACTWVTGDHPDVLRRRVAQLSRGLQSWGSSGVSDVTGNQLMGVLCSVPGLKTDSIAPMCAPSLEEALKFLPWRRPASPWQKGSFLLRTPDGKPYPFAPYSPEQVAWVALLFSGMGGGKSNNMSSQNLSLVLDEANDELPIIRILDIGPSSRGFISLMQSALPPQESHKAVYRRLRMSESDAINIFDTRPGQREPSSSHRSYIQGLLTFMCTQIGPGARPADRIMEFVLVLIDEAYRRYADTSTSRPKVYRAGINPQIDAAIEQANLPIDDDTTWWELVDTFHARRDYRHRDIAQRYAMPILSELAALAREPMIADPFKQASSPTGEPLPVYVMGKLQSAVNMYPILAAPTAFEFSDAPIVSLDLQEVATGESEAARRQAAVVYLIALWVMGAEFFMGDETLDEVSEPYKDYFADLIVKLKRRRKRIQADELHRPAKAAPIVLEILETWVREARKWLLDSMLASQRAQDFPKAIVDLATAIYILKAPTTGTAEIAKTFQLSPTDEEIIRSQLHGPGKEGAPFLAKFDTKRGTFTHHLVNTIGPRELWAFSTSVVDTSVRDPLYKRLGPVLARDILSRVYPGGTVENEVAKRLAAKNALGDTQSSVTDDIIEDLVKRALRESAETA